jgi:hypothetical protein
LLQNESYLPAGSILKSSIQKENKRVASYNNRYIVLGTSSILIFTDSSMREVRNIIPIMPCSLLLQFDEEHLKMKIRQTDKKYIIKYNDLDQLQIWRSVIILNLSFFNF